MREALDALDAIQKIYTDGVKSNDKKGFGDKFKLAMKTFEKAIKKDIKVKFKDVKYLDGYFIFGTGTNSVVHFRLEETPGWLYGIWWSIPKKYYNKKEKKMLLPEYVEGHFFAQYEKNIGKFKPSASTIQCEFSIVPNDNHCSLYNVARNIEFIMKEPYLAFCRDNCFKDYNYEYLSRSEARRIYKRWHKKEYNYNKWNKILDDRFIAFVKRLYRKEFESNDFCITDNGEDCYPRYDIAARASCFPNLEPQDSYCLFDESDTLGIKAKTKWDKRVKKYKKIADRYNFVWYQPFNELFHVVEDKKYDKLKKYEI